ncbi:MAG: pyridoxal-phosphate dependent enzyme, partial [Ignavibacteriae bacterium]|nr:pyridoxal-phosphate dependent enzyme [Ignavibacteriota bacterium]
LLELGWIEKLPKLIAVQAEGSDAIIRYLETNKFEYKSASTIADSISAGAPRNLFMAVDAVIKTKGKGIRVSDGEIISAQKILAKDYGVLAEPAASAALAGFIKLKNEKVNLENSMLMLTGNGLKDVSSLLSWNEIPIIKSYDKWSKELS